MLLQQIILWSYTLNKFKAKKTENDNEGSNYEHITLLIHVYALAKISSVK